LGGRLSTLKQINGQGNRHCLTLQRRARRWPLHDLQDSAIPASLAGANRTTYVDLDQQMKMLLDGAAFGGQPVSASDATPLIDQANALVAGATCP
jgi:hypothetical protein